MANKDKPQRQDQRDTALAPSTADTERRTALGDPAINDVGLSELEGSRSLISDEIKSLEERSESLKSELSELVEMRAKSQRAAERSKEELRGLNSSVEERELALIDLEERYANREASFNKRHEELRASAERSMSEAQQSHEDRLKVINDQVNERGVALSQLINNIDEKSTELADLYHQKTSALSNELERQRQAHSQALLDRQVESQRELDAARALHDQSVTRKLEELEAERKRCDASLAEARETNRALLAKERADHEEALRAERATWEQGWVEREREAVKTIEESAKGAQAQRERIIEEARAEATRVIGEAESAAQTTIAQANISSQKTIAEATRRIDLREAEVEALLTTQAEQHERIIELKDREIQALTEKLTTLHEVALKEKTELEINIQNLNSELALEENRASNAEAVVEAEKEQIRELYEQQLEPMRQESRRLLGQLERYRSLEARFGQNDPSVMYEKIINQEQTIAELNQRLAGSLSISEQAELQDLRRDKTLLEEQKVHAERVAREKDAELAELKSQLIDAESIRVDRERLKKSVKSWEVYLQDAEKRAAKYEGILNKDLDEEKVTSSIKEPLFKNIAMMIAPEEDEFTDENKWLASIAEECKEDGLIFNKRLLYSFHTSLKCAEMSPITVLAGVSGTGKSELPRRYAQYGGLNSLSVPVEPNWDSPQSLFGFYNSIEKEFDATEIIRLLYQSQLPSTESGGMRDQLFIVLLDEMNLAHVELYFSDLLSRLEERRGKSSIDHPIKLGAGLKSFNLSLTDNVMFVGTMNQDETTRSLSDKVLDRAGLLNFPAPTSLYRRSTKKATRKFEPKMLHTEQWAQWQNMAHNFTQDQIRPYQECLERVNNHLTGVGRAVGHRVWQGVEQYMSMHPEVIVSYAEGDQSDINRACNNAFEDALVMKLMAKLRGIETTGQDRQALDLIKGELDIHASGLSEDYLQALSTPHGAFDWRSALYLQES